MRQRWSPIIEMKEKSRRPRAAIAYGSLPFQLPAYKKGQGATERAHEVLSRKDVPMLARRPWIPRPLRACSSLRGYCPRSGLAWINGHQVCGQIICRTHKTAAVCRSKNRWKRAYGQKFHFAWRLKADEDCTDGRRAWPETQHGHELLTPLPWEGRVYTAKANTKIQTSWLSQPRKWAIQAPSWHRNRASRGAATNLPASGIWGLP